MREAHETGAEWHTAFSPIASAGTIEPVPSTARPTDRPRVRLEVALTRLGHECPERCTSAAATLGAYVWLIRRRERVGDFGRYSHVVIDTGGYRGSSLQWMQLVREINECAGGDGIRVGERRTGDAGRALAAAGRRVAA